MPSRNAVNNEGIVDSFAEIYALSARCKYSDCSHADEPGCAVLRAIVEGSLQPEHYQNFIKLRSESEYYDMSYLDKHRKNKAFGRFIKSAKKDPGFTRKQ